ncbi:hypothetical protein C3489_06385 [Streptomyces sp. Ru71]|uniref:hypothetical protein n=1 Tax=Streptomyces sp. Ru71 TaxID=2080746 RepID=UPI000CDE1A37|nr:hypothetical protein [Streptomyces sp. Ru71]POX56061.1 hypothetical protein C3489_06385 [Streptomyces sp. Ru71]
MGSLKVTLCAGAAMAAAALTPTAYAAAHAADAGGVSVTPSSPAPGADVTLTVRGCTGGTATAASTAFVADAHLAGADGTLAGETKVRSAVAPGAYDVKVACAGRTLRGRITVVRPGGTDHPARPTEAPAAPASPVAPVHAGGGGTAPLTAPLTAADTRADGPGTGHTVMGLVLAGVAGTAVVARGVARRSRGTH